MSSQTTASDPERARISAGNITSSIGVAIGNGARSKVRIDYHERWRPPPPREVPGLPPYYCARPELLQSILGFLSSPGQAVIALTGLEGVGKTTLSSELAHLLQKRFAHGVLWGECQGRSGELNDLLGSFLARLGADRDQVPSYNERVTSLRSMLANRQVLIVFDNLLDTGFDPRSLLSAHDNSCVLITTPNRDLAAEVADEVLDVPPLNAAAAQRLLQQIARDALVSLSAELLDRLLEQSGRVPGLLVELGRQARRLRRQGPDALEEWARTVTLDWHDLKSLYEFTFYRLDSPARQAFELTGMFAQAPFNSAIIAAGLRMESSGAERLLAQLESCSLLDREVDGRFAARTPAYHFAQKQLAASGSIERYLGPIVDYIVDLLDRPTLSYDFDNSILLHAEEIIQQCLTIQDWPLLHRFSAIKPRQSTISGVINLWYRSDYFLCQFSKTIFSHATVSNSAFAVGTFIECNFATATLFTVNLPGAQFVECNCADAQLLQIDLRGAQFVDCNCANAQLLQADLRGAQFVECNFVDSRLLHVDLRGAQFVQCNFAGSHFIKTDMRGARFVECNFANRIFADVLMQDTAFITCNGISAIEEVAGAGSTTS